MSKTLPPLYALNMLSALLIQASLTVLFLAKAVRSSTKDFFVVSNALLPADKSMITTPPAKLHELPQVA